MLQDWDWKETGQSLPPEAGGRVLRRRTWEPVPQDLVQDFQAVQAPTWQSAGQAPELQLRCSEEAGQRAPPATAETTVRERDCLPPPQVVEQVVQAPHLPTLQSTGQG